MFVPLIAAMMYISWRVDPSGLFWGRGFERQAALDMIEGNYLDGYERLDGRAINEVYAKNVSRAPDIIVNGSSRSMLIDSSFAADGLTLYNAGNVGADIYDFFNSYYCFAKEGKEPGILVLGIDPWIFNEGEENIDDRSNKEMYFEFISEELGYTNANYVKDDPYKKYYALIDPAYFQASVSYYFRDKSADVSPQIVPKDEIYNQKEVIKCPDGSIIYDMEFRTRPYELADHDALVSSNNDLLRMSDYDELCPEYIRQFESFIEYLQAKDIKVVFFLAPFHQWVYNAAVNDMEKYHCLFETEEYLRQTAKKYNIEIYGSYSPFERGMDVTDFLDGYHLKQDSIRRILPEIE